ncbi:MAG: response regulator [Caldilineaceae bacterium]|nr:response regulator [Caldilineaceae bacterium]
MANNLKQILLIDNDPRMVRTVPRRLQRAGYAVVVARNVAEASHAIAHALFQLAIIDIRLEDERNDTDTSGFMLARQLPPTIPCLFHTAHDTKDNIREALGVIGAEDILSKADPEAPRKLVARVDELFRATVGVNFSLKIRSSVAFTALSRQLSRGGGYGPCKPQAADLHLVVRRLFPAATQVQLSPLLAQTTNGRASASGALLLKAQEKRCQGSPVAVVLKLGETAAIAEEAAHYRASKPFLGGQRLAQLEGEAYSRKVGGLLYTLIGAQDAGTVHPLADVIFTQPSDVTIQLLRRFFRQTFGQIYADAQPATLDLSQHYTTQLGLTVTKLRNRLRKFDPALLTAPTLPWPTVGEPLPNPVPWAIQRGAFRSMGSTDTRVSLCHGDLHSRNILVDDEHHFWLIDFARSTTSHILRDFAELETDLKFQVLPEHSLADFTAFERALATPTEWAEEPIALRLPPPLQQTFAIIVALRQIARELLTLSGPMAAYQQALFWHALNVARFTQLSDTRRQQALVAAALLLPQIHSSTS